MNGKDREADSFVDKLSSCRSVAEVNQSLYHHAKICLENKVLDVLA